MIITYAFMIVAVALGTASNIFAKEAEGFTKLFPSLLSAITIILCMYCLSQVMKTISADIVFMTCDKQYIQRIIVMALKREGNNLVKPSASFANIFDAVPSATATIIKA